MRVLHLDSGRTMQGGQWQVRYLVEGLAAHGIENQLLARTPLPGAEAFTLAAVARWRGWADLVHAHDARAHALALLAGAPVVVSRRVAFPIGSGWLSQKKYQAAQHFIAVSRVAERQLVAAGIKPERVTVVYDGVPLPEARGREGTSVVCPAGKDLELAQEACQAAGVALVRSIDLAADLADARLMLYFSRAEGLGSAALLAMAHGVPVVASRIEGLAEAVEDGVTGLLVDNDASAAGRAIRRLLADDALRARMARAARRRAEVRFSIPRMVAETVRVYEKVAK